MDPSLTLVLYKKWFGINEWAYNSASKSKGKDSRNKYCLKNTEKKVVMYLHHYCIFLFLYSTKPNKVYVMIGVALLQQYIWIYPLIVLGVRSLISTSLILAIVWGQNELRFYEDKSLLIIKILQYLIVKFI